MVQQCIHVVSSLAEGGLAGSVSTAKGWTALCRSSNHLPTGFFGQSGAQMGDAEPSALTEVRAAVND